MVKQFLLIAGQAIPLVYIALDGHFGNNNALQMVLQCGLHLVSKLRCDSALYFAYQGPDTRRKYGTRIDYANIPAEYLKETTTQDDIRTDIYQITALHKEFAQPLNVVIIVKTNHRRKPGLLLTCKSIAAQSITTTRLPPMSC